MAIKLIVIDLDETLLKRDKTYDIERFDNVLKQLRERDVKVCIATGNSHHKVLDYFIEEEYADLYFACDNGNYVVKNQEMIAATPIDDDVLHEIIEFVDEFEGFHPVIGAGDKSYFRQGEGSAYEYVMKYNNIMKIVDSFKEMDEGDRAVKIAIYSEHSLDRNKVMGRILRERFDSVTAVTSGDNWLDVYSAQGGKGSAVRALQNKYNISREETATFGDSMNDESMMNEAHFSIAMGNADRELLLASKYQIGSNEDSAVTQLLEEIASNDSVDFMNEYLIHKD